MVSNKEIHGLIGYYENTMRAYNNGFEKVNRYKAKWAATDLIESYGYDVVKSMIDYYGMHSQVATWDHFTKNSDKVHANMMAERQDFLHRDEQKKIAIQWIGE